MTRAPQQNERLLTALLDNGVQFVVIGGVAAIAHGGATATADLDVVASMAVDNLQRLVDALAPFSPTHVTRPDLGVIGTSGEALRRFRFLLLNTTLGRLDILREVEPIGTIEHIDAEPLALVEGRLVPVITIDQLIAVKHYLGRPKDLLVEQELRAIKALRASRG